MAIQIPNPGTGNGASGDNEFVLWSKVKDNFNDQTNAASRLVGRELNNLVEMKIEGVGAVRTPTIAGTGWGGTQGEVFTSTDVNITDDYVRRNIPKASRVFYAAIPKTTIASKTLRYSPSLQLSTGGTNALLCLGTTGLGITVQTWNDAYGDVSEYVVYTDKNTTVDVNKNIKQSSPVLQVFKNSVKKIHEANELPIKFTRNDVGDYTIEGTTGLRDNDWQIVIPKDDHDNQMIAFTIEDDNGTIHLKTYKRTFSMETFLFGPDLSTPLDIPDGLWVDLHFNDLPQEQLDEPIE